MQTAGFRRWCDLSGEDGGDKGIMFCYGDPGVGKTFIGCTNRNFLKGKKAIPC